MPRPGPPAVGRTRGPARTAEPRPHPPESTPRRTVPRRTLLAVLLVLTVLVGGGTWAGLRLLAGCGPTA